MQEIKFDIEKLAKKDRKIYDAMTDTEKSAYEHTWVMIETQKAKLIQQKNRSKVRAAREKKMLAEKERKARTKRLIERGAILESILPDARIFSNKEIEEILVKALCTTYMSQFIEELKNKYNAPDEEIYPDDLEEISVEDMLDGYF